MLFSTDVPASNSTDAISVLDLDAKRRCPHCGSNKWKWLETIPASPKTIGYSLLMMYQCERCGKEFLAAEKAQAKLVDHAPERCIHCNSRNIDIISNPDADIDLFFCKQCRCYMGIEHEGSHPH